MIPVRKIIPLLIGLLLIVGAAAAAEDPPVASFSASPDSGTYPLSVQFVDTSTGSPTAWLWDFGDDWTSTVQNPQHTYTASVSATYTVVLEVTNSDGSSQATHTIYTYTPASPSASFSASPTSGNAPLTVQFSDSSTGDPTQWQWEFGDGTISAGKYPAHTYTTAGTYSVILTAYNGHGSDTETKINYITVGSGIVSSATISGTAIDSVTYATLDGATITISNSTGWSTTTTTSGGGYYKFENLLPGAYSVQGAKTGYATSTTYAVQAYADTVAKWDILLQASGVALTGTCYDAETGQVLSGVTVTATQGSAVVTNATGTTGTYALDNFLVSSAITLSASCAGYSHSAITVSPTTEGAITRDLYLIPDSITHSGPAIAGLVTSSRDDQAIQGATVTATAAGGGTTQTALTNPTGFYLLDNLTAGQWGVSVKATDYTASSTYTHTLGNTSSVTLQNIRMDPASQTLPSAAYIPKQVRLTFLSATGAPLSNLTVAVTGVSTTAGTWDWFKSLLGLDVSETNLATTSMSGKTGTDGSITFFMLESVYYTINATNSALGVSMVSNIYPKEEEYVFTILGSSTPSADTRVSWDFGTSAVDDTHTQLSISYQDKGKRTKSFLFSVYDENRTLIHSETIPDDPTVSVSYTLENIPGAVVIWGFDATLNGTAGIDEHIRADKFIRFEEPGAFDFGLPDIVRYWMGFLLLVCVGAMFGYVSLKFAGPIVGIFAMTLKFIDWLPCDWEIASIILVLGCLSYVRFAKDEKMV